MLRATLLMRRKLAVLLADEEIRKLNRQKLAEAEGHLGIEEVANGDFSAGFYHILKAAIMDQRPRYKAKWLVCAGSAPFVSRDRLRQMVTSSLTRSSGKSKTLEGNS
jgi:CTP:molybdopterin cytidylyltransferase MocA